MRGLRTMATYTAIVCVLGFVALTGCSAAATVEPPSESSSTEPSDINNPVDEGTDPVIDDADALLPVGPLYNEIPSSIGEYQLLTPELVASSGMQCSDSPLDGYSDGVFWSFEGTTAKLIYVTDKGVANISSERGYCWTIGPASAKELNGEADKTFPGVVSVTFGSLDEPREDAEIECRSTVLVTGCSKFYSGLVTAVSVTEAVADDTEVQSVFLSQFLNTFVQSHPMVAERTAGFPDMH